MNNPGSLLTAVTPAVIHQVWLAVCVGFHRGVAGRYVLWGNLSTHAVVQMTQKCHMFLLHLVAP